MKIYVTKYAVSEGIRLVEIMQEVRTGVYRYKWKRWTSVAYREEWFETEVEALADAERRRAARIEFLQRQIDKVSKKKINIKEQK